MNKVYYLSFVLFFCSLALPVRGQKALDETIQKNVSLEKEIELLRNDSSKVKSGIKDMLFQIEKDSLKFKELDRGYKSLLSLTSQDSIVALNHYVDSLEKLHRTLQDTIVSIRKDISKKSNDLRNADSELQNMNIYSDIQKQQTYKSNKQYLNQRYSIMSLKKLTEMSNNIDEFNSYEDFSDYQKRIASALNNKGLYDNAWECVSSGKDYQNVVDYRSGINALLEIRKDDINKGIYKLTKEQFNEMDSLDIRLSRFNSGIKELKKIVDEINENEEIIRLRSERNSGSKRDCLDLIKCYIIPEVGSEQDKIYQRYFMMIPYLEKLLKDYWNELKKNPFDTPTKSEKTITNLIAL